MLKILQTRVQHYVNQELPDVKARYRKGRGTRDQITNICWIIEKENSRKISTSLTMLKPLCGSQQTAEYFLGDGNTRSPDLPPDKPGYRSRSNS